MKVKRALLPSAVIQGGATGGAGGEDEASFLSLPGSPTKAMVFLFGEEKPEAEPERASPVAATATDEIQRNYEKLQRSLSQEFHK